DTRAAGSRRVPGACLAGQHRHSARRNAGAARRRRRKRRKPTDPRGPRRGGPHLLGQGAQWQSEHAREPHSADQRRPEPQLSHNRHTTANMLTRPIPQSKEPLPIIGLGTWQAFDIAAERAALEQRKEVLRVLLEAGGKLIDASPMYGRAEAVVGCLLTQMKAADRAFLATKVWTSGQRAGIAQMQASLAKLQTPAIDLMQIHNLVAWRTHLPTLRAWKEQKKFRYIGITHYTDAAL